MKYCKIRQSHWWNTWIVMLCRNGELTHSCFNKERTQLLCLIGFIADEKQGKWELLNHYRAITNIADQNALQEQPHNNHKVHFLERQRNSAMVNSSALSNIEHDQLEKNSYCLTHICCLPAFTDHNCGEISCQELNWGRCKSDSPPLMPSVEFKSEARVNPIWIDDGCNIIFEKFGKKKNKMTPDWFSWDARLQLLCS